MPEAIYKVGDVLEFTEVVPRQFGLWAGSVRGLVVKISDPGYEYLSYRLLLSGTVGTTKNMTLCCAFEKDIIPAAKRVGHIDISTLMFMENDEPDACVESANLRKLLAEETLKRVRAEAECEEKAKENERLRNELDKIKKENEELKAENYEMYFTAVTITQAADLRNELDKIKKENEELKKENGKLAQKISCADKLLAEAANRLYQGRAHLNISAHN